MCVCVVFMYLSVFPLFNETFLLMVIFCYCTNTQRGWINCCRPWSVYKNKVCVLFTGFALKISAAFTTRSLVEQLLPFLFVFLSIFYRKLHLFFVTTIFVSIYLHLFFTFFLFIWRGKEVPYNLIIALLLLLEVEELFNTFTQCNTHYSHSPLLIRDRLVSIATVVLLHSLHAKLLTLFSFLFCVALFYLRTVFLLFFFIFSSSNYTV